jgi:hypothetical protein
MEEYKPTWWESAIMWSIILLIPVLIFWAGYLVGKDNK